MMSEMKMIPCDQVVIKLWEYIDGELTEESASEVAAHLEMCQRCFPHYDFQRSYKEFIRRTSQTEASPAIRRRIFEAILEDSNGNGSPDNGAPESLASRFRSAVRGLFGR